MILAGRPLTSCRPAEKLVIAFLTAALVRTAASLLPDVLTMVILSCLEENTNFTEDQTFILVRFLGEVTL